MTGWSGTPGPLHSYLLVVTRSADDTVHRVIWSRRSGCPDVEFQK